MRFATILLVGVFVFLFVANPIFVIWFADPSHHTFTHLNVHAMFEVACLIAIYLGLESLRKETV